MISDETVAHFTMQALKVLDTFAVSRRGLYQETKIDTNTLASLGGTFGRVLTMSGLPKFGLCTYGTSIKFRGNLNLGDTNGMPMHLRDTVRVNVTKMLMPQHTELIARQMAESILFVVIIESIIVSKHGGEHWVVEQPSRVIKEDDAIRGCSGSAIGQGKR